MTFVNKDNSGIYETFMNALAATPPMQGVSLVYGEEFVYNLNYPLPMVVMYPGTSTYGLWDSGYVQNLNPAYKILWKRKQNFKFVLWAEDYNSQATAQRDADQINILEARVLQGLYEQRVVGYQFQPTNGEWQLFKDAKTRRGRAYVMSVMIDIPVLYITPEYATVIETPITETIDDDDPDDGDSD